MNDLNRHKKSDSVKWFFTAITFILLIVMVAGVCLQVFGTDEMKPSEWFKPDEEQQEQTEETEDNGGANINAPVENGVKLMSAQIPVAEFAANGVSEQAESAYMLTATINPESASNKAVDWSVEFVNPSSEWATGKSVTDYVTITPTADGALTANVECKKPVGEQIKVVVTSRANTEAKAECTLDYARRVTDFTFYGSGENFGALPGFGSNEILIDMVVPSSDELFSLDDALTVDFHDFYLPDVTEESVANTIQYSDYTIKDIDFLTASSSSPLCGTIEVTREFNQEFLGLLAVTATRFGGGVMVAGNMLMWDDEMALYKNPVYFASQGFSVREFNEAIYVQAMEDFIEYLQANPDEPICTYHVEIKGAYSIFQKDFIVRYNPSTVTMPVFNMSLDESNIVL